MDTRGGKPTQYFCNLESRNCTNKTISHLLNNKNELLTTQGDILMEAKKNYLNLFSSKESQIIDINLKGELNFVDIKKLNHQQALKLEVEITYEETSVVLKGMKNNKSPGSDGFTVDFLNFSGKILKTLLLELEMNVIIRENYHRLLDKE